MMQRERHVVQNTEEKLIISSVCQILFPVPAPVTTGVAKSANTPVQGVPYLSPLMDE